MAEDCPRTLSPYRPGIPVPGMTHHYLRPLGGGKVCIACGKEKKKGLDKPTPEKVQ